MLLHFAFCQLARRHDISGISAPQAQADSQMTAFGGAYVRRPGVFVLTN
jgi:hypothetical protein